MRHHFSIWKTTILGGVIFLLPFAVIVFLLGQIVQVIYSVAARLNTVVPQWSFGGVSLAVVLATLALAGLCYAAGLAARRSLARRFSEKIERNVLLFFPRYAIWKSQLTSNVGGEHSATAPQPVLVTFDELSRIGFEIERSAASASGDPNATVTVYLPGSPDPWNGQVVHVESRRVTPLAMRFSEAAGMCEAMGRGASAMLPSSTST